MLGQLAAMLWQLAAMLWQLSAAQRGLLSPASSSSSPWRIWLRALLTQGAKQLSVVKQDVKRFSMRIACLHVLVDVCAYIGGKWYNYNDQCVAWHLIWNVMAASFFPRNHGSLISRASDHCLDCLLLAIFPFSPRFRAANGASFAAATHGGQEFLLDNLRDHMIPSKCYHLVEPWGHGCHHPHHLTQGIPGP